MRSLREPYRAGKNTTRRRLGRLLLAALVWLSMGPLEVRAAGDSAVVIMYHRFNESKYPSTNTTPEQFAAHIKELKSGKYTVLPLPEIVDALKKKKPLPDRTIGLSIDDAFLSVFEQAWPRLREAGLPFTLFVATDPVDRGSSNYMSWSQIKTLMQAGVTIGSQTASHLHMANSSLERNRRDLEKSNARFAAMLGRKPDLIAYPYGETSRASAKLAEEIGFVAGFGQHSGAIGHTEDIFYLPRFAMNEKYGDLVRFRMAANALPLPATEVTPNDPLIGANNPPAFGFTLAVPLPGLDRLNCFSSHEGRVQTERLGATRFEIRMQAPMPSGRTRINCTLPGGDGRWRWLGRQFYVPPR